MGDIQDESFEVSAMNSSAKEFLNAAIADYNALFQNQFQRGQQRLPELLP